jgi:Thiamine pyrophosphate enzyme, N-terminal TPP binding domain
LEREIRKGALSLVETAVDAGVEVCFANPGTTEMPIVATFDAVPGLRVVLGLFEGVCTGAADGWGRMARRPAATLLHLGPGVANGLAHLHNARRARTPVINWIGEHATQHRALDPPLASDIAVRSIGYRGKVPVVVMGYSRGGGLALDLAGLLPGVNVLASGVLSVFPALMDPPLPDYRSIPPTSPIVFLVGEQDRNVSHYGRDQMMELLRLRRYPLGNVRTVVIHSTPVFRADHYSFMGSTAPARRAFWERADALVERAIRAQGG